METPKLPASRNSHIFSFLRKPAIRIVILSICWLLFVSALHFWRNVEHGGKKIVRMGHMPVIANLACPLLEEASREDEIRFAAIKYGSFAEMAESFRHRQIDVAFIIAPLPIVLRNQGVPVRIVYIGNRHESTLVARKDLGAGRGEVRKLEGRTVAVPIRFSGHHLALRRLLARNQMTPENIQIVEMQPPDMAAAMQNGSLDAYFVGEPFAARSVRAGIANVVAYVEDVWPGFMCNVMIVREEMIQEAPQTVSRLVEGAVRSGLWARQFPKEAASIASRLWGQDPSLITYAMDTPPARIQFTRGIPDRGEVKEMFDAMVEAGLVSPAPAGFLDQIVEDRFAKEARTEGLGAAAKTILFRGK